MNSMNMNGCRVCGNMKSVNKYIVDGFHIQQCPDCSLLFVGDCLTPNDLNRYYNKIELGSAYADPSYTDSKNIDNLKSYYIKLRDLIEDKKNKERF